MTRIKDAIVAIGEYEKDGQRKAKWRTVGAVIKTDKGSMLMLDRWFNPAGVPVRDGSDQIAIILKDPEEKQRPEPQAAPTRAPIDDDIPF